GVELLALAPQRRASGRRHPDELDHRRAADEIGQAVDLLDAHQMKYIGGFLSPRAMPSSVPLRTRSPSETLSNHSVTWSASSRQMVEVTTCAPPARRSTFFSTSSSGAKISSSGPWSARTMSPSRICSAGFLSE